MISREVTLDSSLSQPGPVEEASPADELSGSLGSDMDEERLPHAVLEHDDQAIRDGQMLAESADYAVGSFMPDMLFEQLVSRYRATKRLLGETIIRELTGFEPDYIEKNRKISDFKDELKQRITSRIEELQRSGMLDEEGKVTEDGWKLASLVLYTEELDHLKARGLGRVETKERSPYGERGDRTEFKRQRYRDIDVKGSIRRAIRRGRKEILTEDLVAVERQQHGKVGIIYAVDASGSMRGEKLHVSKKAGIALAFRACEDGNDAGLVVFTHDVQASLPPGKDFASLLHALTRTRAGSETDLAPAIEHAAQLFPKGMQTKHVVLITDALPTRGEDPGKRTLAAVAAARDAGVTISLVGIGLEDEGEKLARKVVELGEGHLYRVENLDELDLVVLQDYDIQIAKR